MVKTAHAFALVGLGWLMQMLPSLLPDQFLPSPLGVENTSGLWITFMGWVNLSFGTLILLNLQVLPTLARVLAWRPQGLPKPVTARALRAAVPRMPNNLLRPALRFEARMAAAAAAMSGPRRQPVRVSSRDHRAAA